MEKNNSYQIQANSFNMFVVNGVSNKSFSLLGGRWSGLAFHARQEQR